MQIIKIFLLGFILMFGLNSTCFAKQADNMFAVKLEFIERLKAQEEYGDELYFNITEFSSIDRPRHFQVPAFPTHWLSDYLQNVKNVNLWQKNLKPDEAVTLIISLVERDVPPWNVDDLIGSVKLRAKFSDGKIDKQWSIPNSENTRRLRDDQNVFVLTGDDSEYKISLRMLKVE